jgi:hypothetical protein
VRGFAGEEHALGRLRSLRRRVLVGCRYVEFVEDGCVISMPCIEVLTLMKGTTDAVRIVKSGARRMSSRRLS